MITCKLISEIVSVSYKVSLLELYSQRRDKQVILPRQMSWYLAKNLTTKAYADIGRLMGGRDHSTIHHGVRRIAEAIAKDPQIAANYEALARQARAIGGAADGNEQLASDLRDLEPLDVARAVLDAPLGDVTPTLDQIRAISMGMRHYAAELELAQLRLASQETALAILEADRTRLLSNTSNQATIASAAEKVARSAKSLAKASFTSDERPARKALEAAISNLQTVFERT